MSSIFFPSFFSVDSAAFSYYQASLSTDLPPLISATLSGDEACVRVLLQDERTDHSIRATDESTVLMLAAKRGSVGCLKALLQDGRIDPNAKDIAGRTALFFAIEKDKAACVRALFQDGRADPNARDGVGRTALMEAAKSGKAACMRALLQDGRTYLNASGKYDQMTALMFAALNNHESCIKLLLLFGANPRLETNICIQAKDMTQNFLLKNLLAHAKGLFSLRSLSARCVLQHEIDSFRLPDHLINNLFEIAITGKCAYQLSEES